MNLIDKRFELEAMTNIPSMAEYALEWGKLAADFRAADMLANAELCQSKAEHYYRLADVEYVRLEQTGYVELIPVEFTQPDIGCYRITTPAKIYDCGQVEEVTQPVKIHVCGEVVIVEVEK